MQRATWCWNKKQEADRYVEIMTLLSLRGLGDREVRRVRRCTVHPGATSSEVAFFFYEPRGVSRSADV